MFGKYVVNDDWNAVNADQVVAVGKPVEAGVCGLQLATTEGPVMLRWPSDHHDDRDSFYKNLVEMMAKVE